MIKKPYKTVDFEVVEIWYNNIYEPYTLKPSTDQSYPGTESVKHYAIKIGHCFYELGEASKNSGLHICDYHGVLDKGN